MSPVGTCLIAKARFRIGLSESLSNPCTRSMAFVDGTVSSLMSRLCVCFLTSASWSERKSMRPIVSALTTCWTSLTLCPGVAVSASSRNLTSRSQSCCTTCVYACLPLARCASSITRHTTSFAGHTPSLMSLSIVCGVQKKTRFSRHSAASAVDVLLGAPHQRARLLCRHAADVPARRLLLVHQGSRGG